jgi:hypothetical protein
MLYFSALRGMGLSLSSSALSLSSSLVRSPSSSPFSSSAFPSFPLASCDSLLLLRFLFRFEYFSLLLDEPELFAQREVKREQETLEGRKRLCVFFQTICDFDEFL